MSSNVALSSSAEARVPRHKVFLPAEMTVAGTTSRVHLLNLSQTGALIHAEAPPPVGTTIRLLCGQTGWVARVVWSADKRLGVVHTPRLAPGTVAALIGGVYP